MMGRRFVRLSCVVLAWATLSLSYTLTLTPFRKFEGWRFNSGPTSLGRDRWDCVWQCWNREAPCRGMSFKHSELECRTIGWGLPLMMKGDGMDVAHLDPAYKELFVKGGYQPSYDYDGAEEACELLGAELMKLEELQDALSAGLVSCSCGWIEDMQQKTIDGSRCGASPAVIADCNETLAHAWCIFDTD